MLLFLLRNLAIYNVFDAKHILLNLSKRSRKVELPEDSELSADDIPKHIWYVKANGNHADRFAIELKSENISWKTTWYISKYFKNEKKESKKSRLIFSKPPIFIFSIKWITCRI